ncbi:MAG: efflux RND transporter permease subunit [Candidatus Latescibacteria bacterium]|jgi:copper/silver efflux system protein|nr:efflux RND transporter permease subunit [Candidatus Latescibacterota bacterium]
MAPLPDIDNKMNWIDKIIRFCLENKLVVFIMLIVVLAWGVMVAPFDWDVGGYPRDPVPVDAIPDIGENQQIVFTSWMGRSPQDIEDQISYPLTVSLLGVPGVKTIRSYSMFGFSTIYIIFEEDVEFYWSRSRVLEKLNSLSPGTLPSGVQPSLGPDATALGQIYWYTLEGRDENGNPTGGWDLHELRTVQDWYVRYALMSAKGVSEVASVGGFVKEYQIDIDPDALRAHNVKIEEVVQAIKMSNLDVGARTIEVNKVEYMIRGLGFVKNLADIENSVIKVNDNVPILVKHVANVALGPALRRGALNKEGTEVVGGVVVVRYGENPLTTIKNVKDKIKEISVGLPKKTLSDGTVSQVSIVPFYDRTGLINETLGTLNTALTEEILVTIIVILIMVLHLKSSILISGLLPLAVLMCFIAMKVFGVDANIVALSGIAIAIGTMVDMGIVVTENILKHLDKASPDDNSLEVVFRGASEVGSAVVTAIATTIVSFLPVFTMEAAEGKLFKPLAFTKTFALLASVIVALTMIPPFAHILFGSKFKSNVMKKIFYTGLIVIGLVIAFTVKWWLGLIVVMIGVYHLFEQKIPQRIIKVIVHSSIGITAFFVAFILAKHWLPLGPEKGLVINLIFVSIIIGGLLGFFRLFQMGYDRILAWSLKHKIVVLSIPIVLIMIGSSVWLGFDTFTNWMPSSVKRFGPVVYLRHAFPGLGKEFMPPLDEGSFLYMPTTMPHASISEVSDILRKQNISLRNIPEIDSVVGKLGRAETPLDPAPISMIETVINYKPEYILDSKGRRMTFRFDSGDTDLFRNEDGEPLPALDGDSYTVQGQFIRDEDNRLIPDKHGAPFRLWRTALDPDLNPGRKAWQGIETPDDIWDEIVIAAKVPGTTSAPKLQPIAARIVMLQSGMRAPMGVKIKGSDLKAIEQVGLKIERFLKEVPSVESSAVFADRIVGKPYLEIEINREEISRYGIKMTQVQNVIDTAIGGKRITTTVEGRERYPVRVRYLRELRDSIEELERILVAAPDGSQIPIAQLADISYVRGPQVIKSEDTFLIGYVLFDKKPEYAEVDVVEMAQEYLNQKIDSGEFQLPAGISFSFAGTYENQVRSQKKLMVVLPLALLIIFLILFFQFKSIPTTALIFSGIFVAWMGGFVLIWLYGQPWFLDFSIFGTNMRELFQVHPINLSVAVWVGFLALFGIASDDAVIMCTYLEDVFKQKQPKSVKDIHAATIEAASRRVRPCLMTTATTILALIPVLTSTGRGADILVPMAIPSFGGMLFEVIILLVTPVLYTVIKEFKLRFFR